MYIEQKCKSYYFKINNPIIEVTQYYNLDHWLDQKELKSLTIACNKTNNL